ncbi:MAG: glycosyltransferase [Chitinophagales bacterium]|nr:glycosyltransferase [Chitinophagaceae bacterium]MCB9064327.1 glycosyltransferase [Chitinophagales bacterium]
MRRICTSLYIAGYDVTLVGFKRKNSKPLEEHPYKQVRLPIAAEKGKLLYGSYWLMLFFYLLFKRLDAICAIDLDTIMPAYLVSVLRNKRRVYDAHELFTELKEVITKPTESKIWNWIERKTLPRFRYNYTVGEYCAKYFKEKYGKDYKVVRNATVLKPFTIPEKKNKYILYQGWVNEGRCFEELIPAMRMVDMPLIICGEGNFYEQAKELAIEHGVTDKVTFKGFVPPDELKKYTEEAYIGITLFHAVSKSNEYSLANRCFDYMHHGVPQLAMNFPEYRAINNKFEVAVLLDDPTTPNAIADALNKLITDECFYNTLQQNSMKARELYNWQHEEETLLKVYEDMFAPKTAIKE